MRNGTLLRLATGGAVLGGAALGLATVLIHGSIWPQLLLDRAFPAARSRAYVRQARHAETGPREAATAQWLAARATDLDPENADAWYTLLTTAHRNGDGRAVLRAGRQYLALTRAEERLGDCFGHRMFAESMVAAATMELSGRRLSPGR